MRQRHYFKIFFCATILVCLLQLVSWLPLNGHAPAAVAYSFVIGSDPVDGSTINTAPKVVRIYFATPIGSASSASVYAYPPNGSVDGLLENAGSSVINATNPRELDTPLLAVDKLPQGSYEVRWTAISATDGRTTSGLIGFNLGLSSTGIAGTPTLGPSTSNYFPQLDIQGILATAWDWLVLLALCCWIGIVLVDYLVLPRSSAPPAFLAQARKQSYTLQLSCLCALLVGEVINLILRVTSFTQTLGSSGISPNMLGQLVTSTSYGYFWLLRVGLLVLALFSLWWRGYRQQQTGGASGTLVPDTSSQRFSKLRQQARPDVTQEIFPGIAGSTPLPARSQARVTGAIVAIIPPTRGSITATPRITGPQKRIEPPILQPSSWQIVGWLALVGAVILTLALSREVVQLTSLPISTGVFTWLALAAQGVWFGSLAYLGFILLPLLPGTDPDRHAETLVSILRRTIPFLLGSIGLLLVSELFLSEATLQTPAQLLNDPYGRALLVRASVLVMMMVFTGYMLFVLLPLLQRQTVLLPVVDAELPAPRARKFAREKTERKIKRTLHALSGLAAVTLLCLALMDFFAPPVVFPATNYAAQTSDSGSNTAPISQTQQAGDLSVIFEMLPARAGVSNTVILMLTDAQGQAVTDAQIKLTINMQVMNMGTANTSITGSSGVYTAIFSASQTFSMAGSWTIGVEIDRPQEQPVHLTFHVMVV